MLAAKFEPGETMVSQRASARSPPKTRRAGGEESSSTANVGQAARTGSSVKLFQRKSAKTQDNYFVQIAVFGAAGDNSSMSSRECERCLYIAFYKLICHWLKFFLKPSWLPLRTFLSRSRSHFPPDR
jgi:hypothetical protein